MHRFACVVAGCTLLLILAGGMVTSTSSGLSVPDWPTTYGYSMFAFPLSKMVGGIFYEHGHRLIASTVGVLTVVLTLWLARREPRPWVRRLGWLALGTVILQGILGGITVLLFLPPAVSIGHAGLAQIFFCLTVCLALVTSPGWREGYGPRASNAMVLQRLTIGLTFAIYAQILVGATMRHTGAGLAIPDFPWAFGRLVPPVWNSSIAIHYAHRVGALLVALAVARTAGHVILQHPQRPELRRPAVLLATLVIVQIALGAWTVLSGKRPEINTAHVATGSLVLATSLVLALRANRARFHDAAAPDRHRVAHATRLGTRSSIGARA